MDRIRIILETALEWVSLAAEVPVAYAAADSVPVVTRAAPLLEFGLHSEGSESAIEVGDLRRASVPGTLAVLNAHFGNRGTPRTAWRFWCVSLDATTFPEPGIGAAPLLHTVRLRHPARVLAQFEAVGRQYKRRGTGHRYRLKAEVLKLLAELYDTAGYGIADAYRSPACQAAIEAIEARLADPDLDLGRIARAASLSVAQLCRVFRAETGSSPMKHVTVQRLNRARDLLRKTALNVSEVARATGFRDPLHFSRVFRAREGVPPSVFRNGPA